MGPAALWLRLLIAYAVLVALGLWLRPLMPVDETRYATVAWEMWARGDWLVPHLNGTPYAHKPPLLFWIIHAGWSVFGVNAWWPRLIGPLSTVLCLVLLRRLTGRLWPANTHAHGLAAVVFLGTSYMAVYSLGLMFDLLLLVWILLAWLALWRAANEHSNAAMLGFGLCVGLALLTKGPVALVYTVPLAFAIRWWGTNPERWRGASWFGRVALVLLLALALPMLWLAAVAQSAGDDFLRQVLWEQTADRIAGEIGHGRPWWWYLKWLPMLALPWILWPPVWRAWGTLRSASAERGTRFVAIGFAAAFVALSATGGKQVHYLIPLLALAAMLLARLLADANNARRAYDELLPALLMSPLPLLFLAFAAPHLGAPNAGWLADVPLPLVALAAVPALWMLASPAPAIRVATARVGVASVLFGAVVVACVFTAIGPRYDLKAAGVYVGAAQRAGRPVAYLDGDYRGEFGFHGRLQQPIRVLRSHDVPAWLAANPDGLLVTRTKRLVSAGNVKPAFRQPYKSDELVMLRAADARAGGVVFRD